MKPFWCAILLFAFFGPVVCFGQAFPANLTGRVMDPNGLVIPAASVRIQHEATGEVRQSGAAGDGRYTFSQLLPGLYTLTVESPGFSTSIQRGIELRANQSGEVDVSMVIGQVAETVEVSGSVAVIDTQTANQSVSFASQDVLRLPVSLRSPFAVVHDTAGVTSIQIGQASQNTQDQFRNRFAMNGGRDMSGLTLLDGVPAGGGDFSGLIVSPAIDSTQEVQVIRNSYETQFGKSGGGVVSIVSKGGSNSFHGTAFEFLRNDNLDANSWENNRNGRPKTEFRRNQFGGNISGPISKSRRLYFFGGFELLRQGSPTSITSTIPTPLQRNGDFSQSFNSNGSLQQIFDPFSTRANPAGAGFVRDAFPGNRIPSSRFDKVGKNVMDLYPAPTSDGDAVTNARNFFGTGATRTRDNRMDFRVDWAHSEKHTFYTRLTYALQEEDVALYYGRGADTGTSFSTPRIHGTIGNTFVPNPSWVINAIIGLGRYRQPAVSSAMAMGINGTSVGLPAATVAQFAAPTMPTFTITNYANLGNARYLNFPRETHNLQLNLTNERGSHSLKFGFSFEKQRLNSIDVRSADFTFDRGMTSGPAAAATSAVSGNTIASLLLGAGSSGSAPITVTPATTQTYYAGYFQDSWRVTPRLTLNMGLRYEVQRPRTERFNRYNFFNFDAANPVGARVGLPLKGGLQFVTPDDRGQTETDWLDFAPRISLALKVTNKLVMRAGYGIFYLPTFGNALQGGPAAGTDGYTTSTDWVASQGGDRIHPLDLISNPFPRGLVQPIGNTSGLETLLGQSLTAWARNHPTGYMQNYSIDFQYELKPGLLIELGYSGNQGRKLAYGQAINADQLDSSLLARGAALDAQVRNPFFGFITTGPLAGATVPAQRLLRPYPQFNSVDLNGDTPGTSASFNALTAKYTQRFSAGLMILSSYQWAKVIDNSSESQGWIISEQFRNYYDGRSDRSISAHDIPHSFVTTLVYELPVGKGRRFGTKLPGVAEHILGGWAASTVVRFATGFPFQLYAPNSLGAYGFNVQHPNISNLKDLNVQERTPERWFNAAAVTVPASYTIGNAPRFMPNLRSDGSHHLDFALLKMFHVRELLSAEFRAEFFNFTNSPQFGVPVNNLSSGDFGRVNGTRNVGPRSVQLGLKLQY